MYGLPAPVLLDVEGHPLLLTESSKSYQDPHNQPSLTQHVEIGIMLVFPKEPFDKDGNPRRMSLDSLTEQQKIDYVLLQGLINNCIINAEDINRKLKRADRIISFGPKALDGVEPTLDFMGSKNRVLCFVRTTEPYKALADKPLRRSFDRFVIYRNIFTHGKLRIRMPEGLFYIEHIDNHAKKTAYMSIDVEVVEVFLATYSQLSQLLKDIEALWTKENS
ncbi:hypothetical protein [Hymenobacter elongatus]|uniref:Uncharacterized protein n=1 Tax=Hymenobacter elongatus TaxID=877208 RepID=A0A4Z0PGD8_9BACT|nr:hypothetical protein [Hymenobacter elongatus]TGE14155.1 hypothetical protein E5J99_17120 [Hymenobacter elongatus]